MPLTPGTKLGSYEVVAALGAGGMGEVYRARDSKLGRDVALKVLADAFAADAERMGRFSRFLTLRQQVAVRRSSLLRAKANGGGGSRNTWRC